MYVKITVIVECLLLHMLTSFVAARLVGIYRRLDRRRLLECSLHARPLH